MFELNDKVYINCLDDIDRGSIGMIWEINGDLYRVKMADDDITDWLSEDQLESAAAKSYYYSEIRQ